MISQTNILLTCIPNGISTSPAGYKVSMVVTPQFQSNSTTDQIIGTPFEDWPAFVSAMTGIQGWAVGFNNPSAYTVATVVDHMSAAAPTAAAPNAINVAPSTLWKQIFPNTTPAANAASTNATPDFRIHSYDSGKIALAVRAAHAYAVSSHATHGKLVLTGSDPYSVLLAEHRKAKALKPKMAAAIRGLRSGRTHEVLRDAYLAETGDLGVGYELVRHALFFDPGKHRADVNPEATPMGTATTPVLPNDLNTLIGHVGAQPALMRKLGLILDLILPTLPFAPPVGTSPQPTTQTCFAVPNPKSGTLPTYAKPVKFVTPSIEADVLTGLFRPALSGINPVTTTSGGSINNGFLPLGDIVQYTIYTEDSEGTPFKLNTSATIDADTKADLSALPALRTAGLQIAQTNREGVLAAAGTGLLSRQSGFSGYWSPGASQASGNATLCAEDVVRGYAIDVAVGQNSAQFQSLCLRNSSVYVPGLALTALLTDEGSTKATAGSTTTAPNADGSTTDSGDLNLHSCLFGWEGWSMAVQRPGRAITAAVPAGDTVQTETPTQPVNTAAATFPSCQMTVRARAGSLPKLRFGQYYTFRARAIDLAGNDMSVASAPAIQFTSGIANPLQSQIQYLRYEPVPNPVLLLQQPLTEGEHLENMVIRSNPWGFSVTEGSAVAANATQYAANAAALNPMNAYSASNSRWVAPPKGAWGQAEQLGAFDSFFTAMSAALEQDIKSGAIVGNQPYVSTSTANSPAFFAAKTALYTCSQKEAGLFTDTNIWDSSNTSVSAPSLHNVVDIITPPTAQNLPPPTDPGQGMGTGQYVTLPPGQIYMPYLPDANAQGVLFQQLSSTVDPGVPPSSVQAASANTAAAPQIVAAATRTFIPRSGYSWPEIDIPMITLSEATSGGSVNIAYGSKNPSGLDPVAPLRTVPGATPTFPTVPTATAVSFMLFPGEQYSVYYSSTVADVTKMASFAAATLNDPDANASPTLSLPPYAPYRVLKLVHAVQQPRQPNGGNVIPQQSGGKPQVGFAPRNPGDTNVTFEGSFTVDGATSSNVDLSTAWAELVDSEVSAGVQVTNDGTNRRYAVKSGRIATWTLDVTSSECDFGVAPSSNPNGTVPPALVQQCGDTKTRMIFLQATATSRFREYFPASLQSDAANFQNSTPQMPLVTQNLLEMSSGIRVPSTAAPSALKISHVVPTYGYSSVSKLGKTTNTRTGRGLRVFVERPWFTTGDTEMLGVVLCPTATSTTAPQTAGYGPYVTQWGPDPIRYKPATDILPLYPDHTQIVGGTLYSSVPLAENSKLTVDIVAFPPQAFDPERNLWYFDIEFAALPVESPFVRLSLVRFQPNALNPAMTAPSGVTYKDLRTSAVALADMVKVAADRTAAYTINTNGTVDVVVTGQVYANTGWSGAAGNLAANTPAPPGASAGRVFYAQLQQSAATTPGEFDWTPVGAPTPLAPYQLEGAPGSTTTFSYMGAVSKPTTPTGKYQLVVTEHELFLTDDNVAFPALSSARSAPQAPALPAVNGFPAATLGAPSGGEDSTSRIIFSDILPLPY